MIRARKLIALGVLMLVTNLLYAGAARYAMVGSVAYGPIFDATYWQVTTLFIVWIGRKELTQ